MKKIKLKLKHLNISEFEIERSSFVFDMRTQIHLRYSELIKKTKEGAYVLTELKKDPRVKELNGQMISKGSMASRFEPETLVAWFLWAINRYGQKVAEKYLNEFLNSPTIPVINTLWVLGIEVNERISLTNDIAIVPITEMPDSREKEYYSNHNVNSIAGYQQKKPKAAITHEVDVVKSYNSSGDSEKIFKKNKNFWDVSKLLHETSLILNLIKNISCIPRFSTVYTLPQIPMGLFDGSGGSSPLYDIIGYKTSKVSSSQVNEIDTTLNSFSALQDKGKARFSRVLSRLSQAKRREQIEDKILDLGIALEMALLDDNKNNNQLRLSFSIRGSWLVASNKKERVKFFNQLREIYDYRSQVAHSGILCKNDAKKINDVRKNFSEFSFLAEKIIKKLICEGEPDWSSLILGE